jgi:Spy/CpxP family protein refolding chaperone
MKMKNFLVLSSVSVFTFLSLVSAKPMDKPVPQNLDDSNKKPMVCEMKKSKIDMLSEILKLTDVQKAKIEEILKSSFDEEKTKMDQFKKDMEEIKDKNNNKIKEILNDEQKLQFVVINTYEKLMKDCKEDRKQDFFEGKGMCAKKKEMCKMMNSEKNM